MKILFYGDSITDGNRDREFQEEAFLPYGLGTGYVNAIASELLYSNPNAYEIVNTGISGNKVVDLYQRMKIDCWKYQPDVLSILVGVNDVRHKFKNGNGVEIERYEQVYRMLLEDTKKRFPNIKIILLEPFIQWGWKTEEHFEQLKAVYDYAKVVKKLSQEYGALFVPLQSVLDEYAEKFGAHKALVDGVHPSVAGARVIANEWLKVFQTLASTAQA